MPSSGRTRTRDGALGPAGRLALAGAGLLGLGYAASRLSAARAERRAGPAGRFVVVDGHRLHYVEAGEGPPLVLVHGLGGQVRNFSYALLERLSTDRRVILLDRPGAGFSTAAPRCHIGIVEHADVLAGFIAALGLQSPTIVGHSFGGAVALALALRHPATVGALALIAPLTQPDMTIGQPFATFLAAPRRLRDWSCATVAVPLGLALRRRINRATFAPEAVVTDFDVAGGGVLVLRPSALSAGFSEISSAAAQLARLTPLYPTVAVPTAILYGRQDRVLDPAIHGARTAAAIPGCRYEEVEGGHMLPLTQPDLVARFIRSTGAARPSS